LIIAANPLAHHFLPNVLQCIAPRWASLRFGSSPAREHNSAPYEQREYVVAGGLFSYGPNLAANWRYAAQYVDKILKGANPGDLPVDQPAKFELVINMKTAKMLGLTIAQSLVARADEVIR
jgi:hypothetical protein